MKAELISRMTAVQVEKAHAAYTQLACLYEELCNGPMNARQYREYFAIMDNRESLRKRFHELTAYDHGTK